MPCLQRVGNDHISDHRLAKNFERNSVKNEDLTLTYRAVLLSCVIQLKGVLMNGVGVSKW